mgnify:CR=1 FL=1
MSKLHVILTGAPSNIHPDQLFESEQHLNEVLAAWSEASLIKNAVVDLKAGTLTFDGGSGIIEVKPNDFTNCVTPEPDAK